MRPISERRSGDNDFALAFPPATLLGSFSFSSTFEFLACNVLVQVYACTDKYASKEFYEQFT
jgi:hypothetical protein